MVPVLRGPLPHRGIPDKEQRAKLCSLYLRPWTMLRRIASADVPHIADLDLCRRQDSDGKSLPRRRLPPRSSKVARQPPTYMQRSYYIAWRTYIRGHVVSDHATRIIKNSLLVMAGTGKV